MEKIALVTETDKLKYVDECLKWLRLKMDQTRTISLPNMNPYRQEFNNTNTEDSEEKSKDCIILSDLTYDYFPMAPMQLQCVICQIPTTEPQHYLKNPYSRASWLPLCPDCGIKLSN